MKAFTIVGEGVDLKKLSIAVEEKRPAFQNRIESNEVDIVSNMGAFADFFAANGFASPLVQQFKRTKTQGLPRIFPAVDLLLSIEMAYGVLAGIQDWSKIQGPLRLSKANGSEQFEGMRSLIQCNAGEIVIRDDLGIVASLFQGPDTRTKLSPQADSFGGVHFLGAKFGRERCNQGG